MADHSGKSANVPWILGSGFIGAALIVVAFLLEYFYGWVGVSEGTFVGIGSSFLLAAALFFLERRFLKDVRQNVREAAEQTVAAEVTAQTGGLLSQVQEVQRKMDEFLQQEHSSRVAEVRAMDNPTYGTVARAVAAANRVGGLDTGRIVVQGSESPTELGLEFSWGDSMADDRFGDPQRRELRIRGQVYADMFGQGTGGGQPSIEVVWNPGESFEDVGRRLAERLQSQQRWNGLTTLRWRQTLVNLQTALDWAIRSQWHGGDSDQLRGSLLDMIDSDWVLTSAGLESPRCGFFYPEENFPERKGHATFPAGEEPVEIPPPVKPEVVDDRLWNFILQRAGAVFPLRHGPFIRPPTWRPLSEGPDDE